MRLRSNRSLDLWLWRAPAVLLLLWPADLPSQEEIPHQNGTISLNVNLVVLHVTVCNRKGEFVTGLQEQQFQVFEDGQPQKIRLFQYEDAPVSVGLVVDGSTSMSRKRKAVTEAALTFVRSSNPLDQVFVINFNERVSLGLPSATLFSASTSELEKALESMPPRGMTALYDAVEEGLSHLRKGRREKKVLIVISDGGDNASQHRLPQVLSDAKQSDAIIYAIGLLDENDADQKPGVLKKIARVTGGEAFFPNETAEAVPICERIAQDIRHQYMIGYVSSNQKLDNTYRRIRVTLIEPQRRRLLVRAREGYIAAPKDAGTLGSMP